MSLDWNWDTSAKPVLEGDEEIEENADVELVGLFFYAPAPSTSDLVTAKRRRMAERRKALNRCKSPLLWLPPELIEHIIIYAAEDKHIRKWMGLGHVCSVVRDVLLGIHRLWGGAICSFPGGRHRKELLERAGPSAPLSLSVPSRGGAWDATQFSLDRLDRARVLTASRLDFLEQFLQSPASARLPYLEEVELKHDRMLTPEQPPKITPRLKHVKLVNVLWAFSAPSLVDLTIECHKTKPIYPPSLFIDVLRNNSTLKTLTLKDCLPFIPDDLARDNPLSLLFLSLLSVCDRREHALQFWSLISVASDAQVAFTLKCATRRSPPHPHYTGPPPFEDSNMFMRHLEYQHSRTVTVTGSNPTSLSLAVAATTEVENTVDATYAPRDVLELTYVEVFAADGADLLPTPRRDRHICFLRRVYAGLGLLDITHLSWKAQYNYDSPTYWAAVLSDFSMLEQLSVVSLSKYLCQALHPSLRAPLLPGLRALVVEQTSLQTEERAPLQFLTTAGLLDMLHARSARGHPLKMLKLSKLQLRPCDSEESRASFTNELNSQFPGCYLETT